MQQLGVCRGGGMKEKCWLWWLEGLGGGFSVCGGFGRIGDWSRWWFWGMVGVVGCVFDGGLNEGGGRCGVVQVLDKRCDGGEVVLQWLIGGRKKSMKWRGMSVF